MTKKSNIIEFNTPYGKQPPRCFFETQGESLTQQQFQEETEINNILRSHDRNGVIEHIHRGNAIYADFSNVTDLSDAVIQIREAQQEFLNIPSKIREKFKNDAGEFFKFASNPDNLEEMREMGLANPKQESIAMPIDNESSSVDPQKSKEEDSARITT
jgi:phage internal scaffolding protein